MPIFHGFIYNIVARRDAIICPYQLLFYVIIKYIENLM